MGHGSNQLQNLRVTHYVLAVVTAAFLFCVFIAVEVPGASSPGRSVSIAAVSTAAVAALFAWVWPRRAWVWGALVSCGFTGFLVVVFGAFLWNGQIDAWPLVDALAIAAAACMTAIAVGHFRARTSK